MQPKQIGRRAVDGLMVLLLPLLMAEVLFGQELHEWLGTAMLALFLVHHLLNRSWWKIFWRGKYTPVRALSTTLDLLLLADMLALGISGILMSGFVFRALPIRGGMLLARELHLFASHWGLVLLSAHLGLHLELFFGLIRKALHLPEKSKTRAKVLRILAVLLSAYGLYAFFAQHIPDYLFLQTHFILYDETKPAAVYLTEILSMIALFAAVGHYANKLLRNTQRKAAQPHADGRLWKVLAFAVPALACVLTIVCLNLPSQGTPWQAETPKAPETAAPSAQAAPTATLSDTAAPPAEDGFLLIPGGSFSMGSPEDEPWRSDDETQHTVSVSDFYISPYEVRQSEYAAVTGSNPSSFQGEDLPVENVSWLEAIAYCNALSERQGLTPAYTIDGTFISWDRSANGYRLPTEAEWEYACRAGTETPFNTETSISPEDSNYYGHYPYEIENNYFSQGNLTTKPGQYRQTTVAVGNFSPNGYGLYNMHGNVSEWVWDYYGPYDLTAAADPAGPETGTRRVYRGGGWNDFAKNLRSAYRAALPEDQGSFNLGIRLVRNAAAGNGSITSAEASRETSSGGKVLIAFFSWGGNTRGIAQEIQAQTGADLFEIQLVTPYSSDFNTVLDEAQRDQNRQARPEIANQVENFDQYV